MITIKKYGNRRLYDTDLSRYITLDELAGRVRQGDEVRVVDAKSGDDLTQPTLVQLVLESPAGRLLPVQLLHQLLRMQDDALAEFFGRHVTAALDLYLVARDGAHQLAPYFPFAGLPMQASAALWRLLGGKPRGGGGGPRAPAPSPDPCLEDELEALRAEVAGLRDELRARSHGTGLQ